MKQEKNMFLITGSTVIISFDDPTITPDTAMFWVDSNPGFHGDDDGSHPGCTYGAGLFKNDKSIHIQNGSTVIASGKVNFFDEGEMWLTFSTVPATEVFVNFKVKQF